MVFDSDDSNIADSVNWVEAGGVTPVKDQIHCGACWAFSTIGALEGAYFAKYGELLTFSEQQLIDCDTHDCVSWYGGHNEGCHGGSMIIAFDYFKDTHPMLKTDYPYTSGTGYETKKCLYFASKAVNVKIGGWNGGGYDLSYIKTSVQKQPVSTAINANNKYIHSYASGIIDASDCSAEYIVGVKNLNPINHGVLIVGYGHDKATGLDYYLLKNSWNTTWGDKGYFKIKMGDKDDRSERQ